MYNKLATEAKNLHLLYMKHDKSHIRLVLSTQTPPQRYKKVSLCAIIRCLRLI